MQDLVRTYLISLCRMDVLGHRESQMDRLIYLYLPSPGKSVTHEQSKDDQEIQMNGSHGDEDC